MSCRVSLCSRLRPCCGTKPKPVRETSRVWRNVHMHAVPFPSRVRTYDEHGDLELDPPPHTHTSPDGRVEANIDFSPRYLNVVVDFGVPFARG